MLGGKEAQIAMTNDCAFVLNQQNEPYTRITDSIESRRDLHLPLLFSSLYAILYSYYTLLGFGFVGLYFQNPAYFMG